MKNSKAKPPASLSDEAKRWWRLIVEDFEVDDRAGLMLLEVAMKAFDETIVAEKILKKEGPVITDRFGQRRQHPVTLVLRDSRNTMLRSLKQLNLDIQPNAPLGGGK